jgi:predicted amidohydrolase YtcJ
VVAAGSGGGTPEAEISLPHPGVIAAEEALRAYASGSAYASHAEHVRGTIAPGQLAGLIVLSDDPTQVSPESIADIEVVATFAGGECRFCASHPHN